MNPKFTVRLRSFEEIDEIASAWGPAKYRALLTQLGFDGAADLPDSELRDMALMALQDLPPDDAAEAVLLLRLGERLTAGQRQALSHEMLEDTVFDQYSDMSVHKELFHVSALLRAAFPESFPSATAAALVLEIDAENEVARDELEEITEPLLCRLLADGMPERSLLRRLFAEQLGGTAFAAAEHILWQFEVERRGAAQVIVSVWMARSWAADLKGVKSYASSAFGDAPEAESDEVDDAPPR